MVGDCLEDKESSNTSGFKSQPIQPPLPTIGTTILDYFPTYDHNTNKYSLECEKKCNGSSEAIPRGEGESPSGITEPNVYPQSEDDTSLALVSAGSYDTTNNSLDGVVTAGRPQPDDNIASWEVVSIENNDTTNNDCDGVKASGSSSRQQARFTLRRKQKRRQQSSLYVRLKELGMELEVSNGNKKFAAAPSEDEAPHSDTNGGITFTTKVDITRYVRALADGRLDEIICHFRKRGL